MTAVIASGATGTVQFYVDGNPLGSPVSLIEGLANLNLSSLSLGAHEITAVYSGDSTYGGSTSPASVLYINPNSGAADSTFSSNLRILPFGVPPYSIRAAQQTLIPIKESQALKRSVNGTLIDLSAPQFRKYSSVITVTNRPDVQPPSWDGIFPGSTFTMWCISELAQRLSGFSTEAIGTISTETESPALGLHRPAVPGSIRYESGFVFYRPVLQMMVVDLTQKTDEWGCYVDWTLTSEEV
jgi:hypothetical protein